MVFSDKFEDKMMTRYCTYEEAIEGHKDTVKKVKQRLGIHDIPKDIYKTKVVKMR